MNTKYESINGQPIALELLDGPVEDNDPRQCLCCMVEGPRTRCPECPSRGKHYILGDEDDHKIPFSQWTIFDNEQEAIDDEF